MKTTFACTLLVTLSLLSGCRYFKEGAPQTVSVYSFPAGADVRMSGEVVGQTPMELQLGRKVSHQIVLEKAGYKPYTQAILPTLNDLATSRVKFQIAEDLGYYYDLQPSPVEVQLDPSILPNSRGYDAFGEMTELVLEVDRQRESGQIDPVEHKYIVDRILQFYGN
jgi:hypothetical protein